MDINSALPFEVESISDLARHIVSSSPNQHGTLYLVHSNNKIFLCSITNITGYYNFRGLPVLLFTTLSSDPTGSFVRFDVRADSKNPVTFANGFDETESNVGYIQYLPIIKLKSVPSIFKFET